MTGAIDRLAARADDALRGDSRAAGIKRANVAMRRCASALRVDFSNRAVRIREGADSGAGTVVDHAAVLSTAAAESTSSMRSDGMLFRSHQPCTVV